MSSVIIDKLMWLSRNFETMTPTQRDEFVDGIGEFNVENFFKANQRVFQEDGPRTGSQERREFFLDLLKNRVKSAPLDFEAGHPISNYLLENVAIRELCTKANEAFLANDMPKTLEALEKLSGIHIHYLRKEDQLFPYLEKHNFTYPSTGMWKFHDELRAELKQSIANFKSSSLDTVAIELFKKVTKDIFDMSTREERMLLPAAVVLLSEDEWQKMSNEEREIGYVFIDTPPLYSKNSEKPKQNRENSGAIFIQDGSLSIEQLDLFFGTLPFDVTVVDEFDRVAFFNKGLERTFLRSAGIIGREIRYCHPPKSVDTVLEIVEAFKNKSKDDAEFWINFQQRLVHIRYFALRDKQKNYKGILEITQDITDIQKLTGERRLLEWD